MPNTVQVKGSPDFRFSADFDIGKHLKGLFNKDNFNTEKNIELLDCEKTEIVTYIVYMKLFDEKITLTGIDDTKDFQPSVDTDLASGKLEVQPLDFSEFLKGFSFDQRFIVSKLYLSGNSSTEGISVELKVNNGTALPPYKGNRASGLKEKTSYDKTALPEGGTDIGLKFNGEKTDINYRIYVKAHDTVKQQWIKNPSVLVEITVWLPFNFTADYAGAEVKLPDDLFPEGDLFGRESPDSDNTVTKMLESLSFAMEMNKNPFTHAKLSVKSKGINIENPITSDSLEFAIDEQNMKIINTPANIPFAPKLKLVFDNSGRLSFPRNFFITKIAFKAKLNHTIDL
ncbi:MAG: hypothetical protein LBC76_04995 [Treponema sp.]|nr:hypothetical protein [Treponema sp.]